MSGRPVVFLFDIDGTLLSAGTLAVESYRAAFARVAGEPYSIRSVDCAGRTDPWIVREVLTHHGRHDLAADESAIAEIFRIFLRELEDRVTGGTEATVLPGVHAVLERLAGDARAVLALLTGNLLHAARFKLRAAGLERYFARTLGGPYPLGAFGSDDADRNRLGPIARTRLTRHLGHEPAGEEIWIVGDSVHDIACARAAGFRVLAVASSGTPAETLRARLPDRLVAALDPALFGAILAGDSVDSGLAATH